MYKVGGDLRQEFQQRSSEGKEEARDLSPDLEATKEEMDKKRREEEKEENETESVQSRCVGSFSVGL